MSERPAAEAIEALRAARLKRLVDEATRAPIIGFGTPAGARLSYDPRAVVVRYEDGYPQLMSSASVAMTPKSSGAGLSGH